MNLKRVASIMALPGIAVLAAACGGGGGGGGGGGDDTDLSGVTAVKISSTAVQSATISSNAAGSMRNISATALGEVGGVSMAPAFRSPLVAHSTDARMAKVHAVETKIGKAQRRHIDSTVRIAKARAGSRAVEVIPTSTEPCGVAGTVTFDGTYNDQTGAFSLTMTYSDCREDLGGGDGEVLNGTVAVSSTDGNEFEMAMGNGSGDIDAGDFMTELYSNDFSNLYATMGADLTVSGSVGQGTGTYTFTYTADGDQRYNDFVNVYDIAYTNFALTSSFAADGTSGSDTVTGGFSETWTEGSTAQTVALTFTNFSTEWEYLADGYQYSVAGTVSQAFTPAEWCEGSGYSYTIATVEPVVEDFTAGHTVAGHLTIDGTVHLYFNDDGTVEMDDGSGRQDVGSLQELQGECRLQDFESNATAGGDSGTVNQADTMLVTLAWTGGETSDMDLHMIYYTESPTGTTVHTDEVYYGNEACATCGANLDYDDTEGYGPEHITATDLVDGYYVVSVNSYDLDADPNATVTATINLGSTLFSFGPHTFTTYDLNGTSADAWYRVADILVTDGNASVLTPNGDLNAWGNAGMAAKPRVGK